jgi:hypothetical protein
MEKETRAGGLKSRGWILNAVLALMVFAVNTRLAAEHPNPWGWNPAAYGGVPAQFPYLPALPHLAATLGMPVEFSTGIHTGEGRPPEKSGPNAVMQLRAQAVECVVVHGPGSTEHWKDVKNHRRFEGIRPQVFDDGGDEVFRLPFYSHARLVRPGEWPSAPPVRGRMALLGCCVAAMDDASRPRLATRWLGADGLDVEGAIPADMLVAVRVTHNEGWSAHQNGRRLVVERGKMGFMVVHAESGESAKIRLHYGVTAERRAMAAESALAWIAPLGALARNRREGMVEAA